MMLCPECNTTKGQRKDFKKRQRCGCCNGVRHISWNRYVQWNLGWVLLYQDTGKRYEINLLQCYDDLCKRFGKTGRIIWIPYEHKGDYENEKGWNQNLDILWHYMNQLKGVDCLTR